MARTTISSLFSSSPVRPLQKQMAAVIDCVKELEPFFQHVLDKDWEGAARQQQRISELEREADKLKRELRLNLPNSLFMPVSRRDILEVLTMQDKIANRAKDIAGLILGRRMEIPEPIGPLMMAFVRRSIDAAVQAQTAINELDELVETGFRGGEVELVESMIKKLDEIESDTDRMQVEIRAALFEREKELPPIEVMFLYRIIDWIGDLADRAQRVGSRLELMLAR
ncbi:TIGR00153 family protein [Thiohalobacter sp. IOR34]|uniref:TIGR00153 family protein n=1 Tax=Thiohalobacter sp. IOR34 TaxID=3057176 RepID=UPI0025AF73D3|nr:TIGR00153 family protein [Thiohalobacter sp. IOR34]WJW75607.1 TIGR00153 family protein [Thiohalobacter sp. IOR34]